jgi:predicted nucleic acid-binding Zn ribbon protein
VSRRSPGTVGEGQPTEKAAPERVGSLIEGLFDRLGVTERVERAGVAADWERLVGPHIARVTRDTRASGSTLFVEVVSAAWLTELNMMRHELLRRINAGRTRGRIERIVFLQAGKE